MQLAEDEGQTKVYESHRSLEGKHTLHEMIAEGEGVAVRTTCSRVHSSEPSIPVNSAIFSGRKPSGRSCTVRHIHFYRWVGEKLTEQ